jgi:hypothetical protein
MNFIVNPFLLVCVRHCKSPPLEPNYN